MISRCVYLPESRTRAHFGWPGGAVAQFHASAQLFQRFVRQQRGALQQIGLGDFVFGIREPLGELRVVGHEEQAAGVEIETSDG